MILHVSIRAADPPRVAGVLAEAMGGTALPFPPFPDCWIAFAAEDDGRAVEVYPLTHSLRAGPEVIACDVGAENAGPSATHLAIASPLTSEALLELGAAQGWTTRRANRGPFECIEMWLEDRVLIEWLDPDMQADYHRGMTAANWAAMFGLRETQ